MCIKVYIYIEKMEGAMAVENLPDNSSRSAGNMEQVGTVLGV